MVEESDFIEMMSVVLVWLFGRTLRTSDYSGMKIWF